MRAPRPRPPSHTPRAARRSQAARSAVGTTNRHVPASRASRAPHGRRGACRGSRRAARVRRRSSMSASERAADDVAGSSPGPRCVAEAGDGSRGEAVDVGRAAMPERRWEAGALEVAEVPQPAEADLRVVVVAVHEDAELLGVGESGAVEDAQDRAVADGKLAWIEPERGHCRAEAVGQCCPSAQPGDSCGGPMHRVVTRMHAAAHAGAHAAAHASGMRRRGSALSRTRAGRSGHGWRTSGLRRNAPPDAHSTYVADAHGLADASVRRTGLTGLPDDDLRHGWPDE